MDNENKKIDLANETFAQDYATRQELNAEATMRADSDFGLMEDINVLRKRHNKHIEHIEEINGTLKAYGEKIDVLEGKIATAEGNIETHERQITNLEDFVLERIKELENTNGNLNSRLEGANKLIGEQEDEIERLKKEIADNDVPNVIDLKFAEVQEFNLNEIISVKEFINNSLKSLVVPRIEIRYPEAQFNQDYTIVIDGLDYHDVMQGKNMVATIKALDGGKLIGTSSFAMKINYQYNVEKQAKFIDEFLNPAIPTSLIDIPENAEPNYNVPDEIIATKPLKLLLHDKDFKHLTFKVFGEMNAGSYWSDFHRPWQFIRNGYNGTGKSTIGGNLIINNAVDLYNNISGYHNNIFKMIEQRLNDSGVSCTVTKKWARTSSNDRVLHTLGNLIFNVSNSNLDDDEIIITKIRNYYLMLNFEIDVNGVKKFYRGVTFVMTDGVELY